MSNWPKHKDPTDPSRKATAPYNFVPLPDSVETVQPDDIPGHDTYRPDHTGHIEVKLTTASPLYVRCGWSPEDFDKYGKKSFSDLPPHIQQKVAQFFHTRTANEPVIPGSSLRGMLRSMVEIVSYGKVQPVKNSPPVFFRAVAASKSDALSQPYQNILGRFGANVKAGYLIKQGDKWLIQPALLPKDVGLSPKDAYLKVKERQINRGNLPDFLVFNQPNYRPQYHEVSFEAVKKKDKKGRDYIAINEIGPVEANHKYTGVLVCSGNMLETDSNRNRSPRKNHSLVLGANKKVAPISINKQAVEDYIVALTDFQKQSPPFSDKTGCLIEGRPIFYVDQGKEVVYFGHSPNFRIPMLLPTENRAATPVDMLPEQLNREIDIDFAEAIFGYTKSNDIPEGKKRAFAGRVFVSDAIMATGFSDEVWLENKPLTPKILGGPKTTTFQHYLTQQNPDSPKDLNHYAHISPGKTVIRGHKLYWNKGPNPAIENDKTDASKTQLTQIKPVKPDVSFTFTIHFENLSEIELGALLWVLNKGADENYRLKLGMGKPLGMGAVKTEPTLYLTNRLNRYQSLFEGEDWQLGLRDDSDTVAKNAPKAFEAFIKDNHADAFGGEGRIKQLLALLSWPGPKPNETRYMTIQPTNEFKDRKVLPTPKRVLDGPLPNEAGKSTSQIRKSQTQLPVHQSTSGQSRPQKVKTLRLPQPGEIFTNKVFKVLYTGTVFVKLKKIPTDKAYARIREENLEGKEYAVGNLARCEVLEIIELGEQKIVDCKPGSKKKKK